MKNYVGDGINLRPPTIFGENNAVPLNKINVICQQLEMNACCVLAAIKLVISF